MSNQHSKKHNHASKKNPSPTYRSWCSMKTRCNNPNTLNFHRYGGRGITYPESWEKFENFLSDMGDRPDGTSLDRINNDIGYSKENCRWATKLEQNNNTKSVTFVEYLGMKISISELSRLTGISRAILQTRHKRGIDLLAPVKKYKTTKNTVDTSPETNLDEALRRQ